MHSKTNAQKFSVIVYALFCKGHETNVVSRIAARTLYEEKSHGWQQMLKLQSFVLKC